MPVELQAITLPAVSKTQYCGLVRLDPVAVAVNDEQLPLLVETLARVGVGRAALKFLIIVVSEQPFSIVILYVP